ncbi:MAG: GNAT family N-acetyltransferase [Alphaproteobacteria bacterium]|jgi:GNAT superfamily N-acetyltransferase|nr:GNAT family N-acetyltransferase [Rhodospirillaceae bacterium]MBT6511787.1 GNAT family N-acetyltransferase [Rhodospirillaceae bacterium]MBT7615069.1 GNAT family N-acetyltransferase [Rhodospirillaceae bacterium]MDG2482032.1 GNAT family N-acetyltransferase [Alphaproteobacteria bacterium]
MNSTVLELTWTEGCDPEIAETILRDLPDWFGIEEALMNYVAAASGLPTVIARTEGEVVGFASLERGAEAALDVHVIGVRQASHRQGVGQALITALAERARDQGAHLLTVKTLSASVGDPFYGRTHRFYKSMGFLPAAELPLLWGSENPCLLMVKVLNE